LAFRTARAALDQVAAREAELRAAEAKVAKLQKDLQLSIASLPRFPGHLNYLLHAISNARIAPRAAEDAELDNVPYFRTKKNPGHRNRSLEEGTARLVQIMIELTKMTFTQDPEGMVQRIFSHETIQRMFTNNIKVGRDGLSSFDLAMKDDVVLNIIDA
jgi:hypothetical protein